jgi:hypothetical protein
VAGVDNLIYPGIATAAQTRPTRTDEKALPARPRFSEGRMLACVLPMLLIIQGFRRSIFHRILRIFDWILRIGAWRR